MVSIRRHTLDMICGGVGVGYKHIKLGVSLGGARFMHVLYAPDKRHRERCRWGVEVVEVEAWPWKSWSVQGCGFRARVESSHGRAGMYSKY